MLRDQVFVLDHMYMSLFSTADGLRLAVTDRVVASIHPVLALMVVLHADACTVPGGPESSERFRNKHNARNRLARFFFQTRPQSSERKFASRASATNLTKSSARRGSDWYHPVGGARWTTAKGQRAGWGIFGVGSVGASC